MAVKTKERTAYKFVISDDFRFAREQKKAILDWLNSNPEFQHRKPTIEEVVAECHRPGSPLAGLMITNTREAASQYWRERAQYILRSINVVKIRVRTEEIIKEPVRAYIPVVFAARGTIPEDGYIPAQRVASDSNLKHSVVERARADFMSWLDRYRRYAEFMEIAISVQEELSRALRDAQDPVA